MTTYKKIPLEVTEEDYDRVMKALKEIREADGSLYLNGWGDGRVSHAFGVKFRLEKESKA